MNRRTEVSLKPLKKVTRRKSIYNYRQRGIIVKKSLHFYVIDERTDNIKYCRSKGLIPYKFKELKCEPDNNAIKTVAQYTGNGYVYDVLEGDQCYTNGHMVTLMRLPKLSYAELLNDALNSKYSEERIGATGIILKEYPKEFEQTLISIAGSALISLKNKKSIKRMARYVYELINNSCYVRQLENIRDICKELELRLN